MTETRNIEKKTGLLNCLHVVDELNRSISTDKIPDQTRALLKIN